MSGRYVAIINPAAGGGRSGRRAPAAIDRLRAQGLEVEVLPTSRAGEATELTRAAFRDGARRFIAVGGDGTGFEIVNGLFPEALSSEVRPTLGFLPLGTGNSFLRDFTTEGAAYSEQALVQGRHRECDVIRLKHREGEIYFINLLSLGFVADVCSVTNRRFKAFGEAGYGLGVLTTVAGLTCRPIPFAMDGQPYEQRPLAFVSFCNSRFTGGKMMMAPSAQVGDGLCDVVAVNQLGRVSLLKTFPKIFDGSHVRHPAVRADQARSVVFQLDGPLDAMIDGEVLRLWPERLDVLHHALEVSV